MAERSIRRSDRAGDCESPTARTSAPLPVAALALLLSVSVADARVPADVRAYVAAARGPAESRPQQVLRRVAGVLDGLDDRPSTAFAFAFNRLALCGEAGAAVGVFPLPGASSAGRQAKRGRNVPAVPHILPARGSGYASRSQSTESPFLGMTEMWRRLLERVRKVRKAAEST